MRTVPRDVSPVTTQHLSHIRASSKTVQNDIFSGLRTENLAAIGSKLGALYQLLQNITVPAIKISVYLIDIDVSSAFGVIHPNISNFDKIQRIFALTYEC